MSSNEKNIQNIERGVYDEKLLKKVDERTKLLVYGYIRYIKLKLIPKSIHDIETEDIIYRNR